MRHSNSWVPIRRISYSNSEPVFRPRTDAIMAHETLHEAKEDVSKATRDLHRALVSLQEELQAVDGYRQRADACRDDALKAILLHNMREEFEHSALLIEWLRRNDAAFDAHLRTHVFTGAEATGREEARSGLADDDRSAILTIGTLKE